MAGLFFKSTLLMALGCGRILAAVPDNTAALENRVIARLKGRTIVTERDISDWQAAEACRGSEAAKPREAAFLRLLEAAIAETAMRSKGGPAAESKDLIREAERIDQQTRAPEILRCIKDHFGDRKDRYVRVFVRPAWIESRLRSYLQSLKPPRVQEEWFRSLPKMQLEIKDTALRDWTAGIVGNPRLPAVKILP